MTWSCFKLHILIGPLRKQSQLMERQTLILLMQLQNDTASLGWLMLTLSILPI